MYKGKKILALIPARGGSKGLPRKNIKSFLDKPLIAWTINYAKKATMLDRVIVSTDSVEIAEISRHYGADVPFIRPEHISNDSSSSIDVVLHSIKWLSEYEKSFYDYIALLQPTSPLRDSSMIDNAIRTLIQHKEADSIVSVTEARENPYWLKFVNQKGFLENFIRDDSSILRRQNLPDLFFLNGAIYIISIPMLLKTKSFFTERTIQFYMEPWCSIDIDDDDDFSYAEFLAKKVYK